MYSTSTICTVQNNVYVNMSVYFVGILVERGTSGGRVAGHVTASGPLGTCLYVQGVQNSGYSGLRKVQPKVFQLSPAGLVKKCNRHYSAMYHGYYGCMIFFSSLY